MTKRPQCDRDGADIGRPRLDLIVGPGFGVQLSPLPCDPVTQADALIRDGEPVPPDLWSEVKRELREGRKPRSPSDRDLALLVACEHLMHHFDMSERKACEFLWMVANVDQLPADQEILRTSVIQRTRRNLPKGVAEKLRACVRTRRN